MVRLVVVRAEADVLLPTVARMDASGKAETQQFVQRPADSGVHALLRDVRHLGHHLGIPLAGGLLVDVVDGAGDGVAAVQGALRPPRHLDARQIETAARQRAVQADGVGAVDVGGGGAVRVGLPGDARTNAANHGALAFLIHLVAELEARHEALQIGLVLQHQLFERVLVEGRDRHRHLEDVLLDPLRRHDDLLVQRRTLPRALVFRLRQRRRRCQQQANDGTGKEPAGLALANLHERLPSTSLANYATCGPH